MNKTSSRKQNLVFSTLLIALTTATTLVACSKSDEKAVVKKPESTIQAPATRAVDTPTPFIDEMVKVDQPLQYATIETPLKVKGHARGPMFFEAVFSISIEDLNGNTIGTAIATATGDWMTEDFVPFESDITFSKPATKTGFLILHKSNASGLTEHDKQFRIPVNFAINN